MYHQYYGSSLTHDTKISMRFSSSNDSTKYGKAIELYDIIITHEEDS